MGWFNPVPAIKKLKKLRPPERDRIARLFANNGTAIPHNYRTRHSSWVVRRYLRINNQGLNKPENEHEGTQIN